MMDQLLPMVYIIGVLLLVLPAFLQSNSKLKQFLTNLTIWIIIVLITLTIIYMLKTNTD
jgi:VIT1/CCC1 family predicted Fe2+/Mn2+ transporter